MSKKFYLSVHDLNSLLPGLDDLLRLKKEYPSFKVTCFTIPSPNPDYCNGVLKHYSEFTKEEIKGWVDKINKCDWIEVGIHGLYHLGHEANCSYLDAKFLVERAEKVFDKYGLKYKKIFAAPYWDYSSESLELLRDKGYVVAIRREIRQAPEGLKVHMHKWEFNRELPEGDVILGNGHLNSVRCKDSIEKCYNNILKSIPKDSNFGFISELYE